MMAQLSQPVRAGVVSVGRVLLCVLAAVLMAAAFPPFDLHWLVWFGFLPLLLALRGLAPPAAAAHGGIFGFTFFALTVHWLWNLFGAFSGSLFVISAIFPALFGWLHARGAQRLSPGWLVLLTPTLWVATEYLRAECWALRFGWGALGYSQANDSAVLQLGAIVGVYGVTWLIVFANALLFWTLTRPGDRGVRMLWLAGSLFAGGAKFNDGACRRRAERQVEANMLAACVQGEEVEPEEYARAAGKLGKVDLMVLPECAFFDDPAQDAGADVFERLARRHRAHVVFGCKRYVDPVGRRFRNIALVLDPQGKPVGEYAKRNPVPFFNDGIAGNTSEPIDTGIGCIGVAICFDADFERPCREAVTNGAQILTVPTFDGRHWGEVMHRQHEAMPRFRAVETGRYVVRAASSGYSMIVDPRGDVLVQAESQEPEAIAAKVALEDHLTLYVRWGWLLPRVCLLLAGLAAAGRRRRGRKIKRNQGGPRRL